VAITAGLQTLPRDVAEFALPLVAQTGLSLGVILAWMKAEGGPKDNPLNIGPGRHYGSPAAAARATSALLRTPPYAAILRAAKSGNDSAQLHAIAWSPWNGGPRAAPTVHSTYESLLKRVYRELTHGGQADNPNPFYPRPDSPESQIGGAVTGWVGDLTGWAKETAPVVMLYLTFSALAVAFLVLGGMKAAGGSVPSPLRRVYRPPNLQGAGLPEGF